MSTVLFVCRQNAGRSQMSQALFTRAAAGRHQAISAGTTPAAHVHPEVLAIMNELGIDQSGLPMAPARCTLDENGLDEQLDRYRRLGSTALGIDDRDARLVITFGADVDLDLLREALAIEHACCSFFTLDYHASPRQLSIGIDDPPAPTR
jgi:Low molecular weight phosphotyrosine protein phosphatase